MPCILQTAFFNECVQSTALLQKKALGEYSQPADLLLKEHFAKMFMINAKKNIDRMQEEERKKVS